MGRAAPFKQADLTRAVRGVEKAGIRVASVEIDANGKIIIHSTLSESGEDRRGWEDLD